jgi:hypothetical protein
MYFQVPILLSVQVGDSLTWEAVKLIVQSQYNLATLGVTILVGVAGLLMVGTWVYNIHFERRRIESIVKSAQKELFNSIQEDFSRHKTEVDRVLKKTMIEFEKLLDSKMKIVDAETYRLHARDAEQEKSYEVAALWWARSIPYYEDAIQAEMIRVAVERLKWNLEQCESMDGNTVVEIKDCISSIPKMLFREKKDIETKLRQLSQAAIAEKE